MEKDKLTRKDQDGDKAVDGLEKEIEPWEDAKDMLFDIDLDSTQEHDISAENPELMTQFREELLSFLDDMATDKSIINCWQI